MNANILGIGLSIPAHTLTQEQAVALAGVYCGNKRDSRALKLFYRGTRIENRYTTVAADIPSASPAFFPAPNNDADRGPGTAMRMQRYVKEVVPLATRACHRALEDSRTSPEEISHVIVVTCTGFFAPGLDVTLTKKLNLRPSVQRLQVGFMGCHGALNGMHAAYHILNSNSQARVLLCAAELCSLHMQYGSDAGSAVANALFADGAAALILGGANKSQATLGAVAEVGSCLVPDSDDAMTWHIGDNGFEMTLSPSVPGIIEKYLPKWMENWLSQKGLAISDIKGWAVHPGGPRILDAVETSLHLPKTALSYSRDILSNYGNMSSPTVLFILDSLRELCGRIPLPCVILGFGPGLIVEAVLLN